MNLAIAPPAENDLNEWVFELNYSKWIELYNHFLELAKNVDPEDSEHDINVSSSRFLSCEYLKKSLNLTGSRDQQIKKIKAALILIEIQDEDQQWKESERYFYIAVDIARRYLWEDFQNTAEGKTIFGVYLSKINPTFKALFHTSDTSSFWALLHLIITSESNKRAQEWLKEAENLQNELLTNRDYSDISLLERIEDIFGPVRLQITSEESGETIVQHGLECPNASDSKRVFSNIWYTTVNIFDKPKRYFIAMDRGSNEWANQFETYQLEKWIKPIINIYIEKREWKFSMYVFDNISTLELYEESHKLPSNQNDYRPFVVSVIQRYVNALEFHESREDEQYVNNVLKAINICRYFTSWDSVNLPQKIDTVLWGKVHRRILQMVKTILLSRNETMNGSGYPFGLSKKWIPLESRLYSIIRAYEALGLMATSKQVEVTMKNWASEGGWYFDHEIFSIFNQCMDHNGLLPKLIPTPVKLHPVSERRRNFYTEHLTTWNTILKIIKDIGDNTIEGRASQWDIPRQNAVFLRINELQKVLRRFVGLRTHLVLARHSDSRHPIIESDPNLPGTIDDLLTQKWKEDSRIKGEALAGLQIKILTSPLVRARQTAAIICQSVRGCTLDIMPIQVDGSYVLPSCSSCPGVGAEAVIGNSKKNINNGRYNSYAQKLLVDHTEWIMEFLVDLVSSPEESTNLLITHRDTARHITFWLKNLFDQDGLKGTKNPVLEDVLYECFFEWESMVEPWEIRPNTLLFSLTDWRILVDAINLLAQAIFKEPFYKRNAGRVNLIALHDSFLDWMDEKSEKSPKKFSLFIEWLGSNTVTAHIIEILKIAGILDQNFMVDKLIRPV